MTFKLPIIYNKETLIREITLRDSANIFDNYNNEEVASLYDFGPFETFLDARNWVNDTIKTNYLYGVFENEDYLCHFNLRLSSKNDKTGTLNIFFNKNNNLINNNNKFRDILTTVLKVYFNYLDIVKLTIKVPINNELLNQVLLDLTIKIKSVKKDGFYNRFTGENSNLNLYELERGIILK